MTTRQFKPKPVPAIVQVFADSLKQHKPKRARDIIALGYELRELGNGKYRRCYEVLGHECIVKVPKRYTPQPEHPLWRNPIHHSRIEVETLAMIQTGSAFEHLRRHVPQVYYACLETGLVVMPQYIQQHEPAREKEANVIGQIFRDTLKKWTADYHHANMMQDAEGNFIVVDLGY